MTYRKRLTAGASIVYTRTSLPAGNGVYGPTVCGSTGEGQTLSLDESVRISEIALEEARGRVPVVCGIIRDSRREVIRYAQALRKVGVDGLQITPVHYLFQPGPEANFAAPTQ